MATDLPDIIQKVVREDLINDEQPSLVSQQLRVLESHSPASPQDLYDLDYFRGRVSALKAAFHERFIVNALAVKANSVRGVLREACRLGLGGECASLQEAKHCLSVGKIHIFSSRLSQLLLLRFSP